MSVTYSLALQARSTGVFLQTNGYSSDLHVAAFARLADQQGVFVSVTNPFSTYTVDDGQPCTPGLNHVGDDFPGMPVTVANVSTCQALCSGSAACAGFVVLPPGCEQHATLACYLKTKIEPMSQEACPCAAAKPFAPQFVSLVADYLHNMLLLNKRGEKE